MLQHWWELFIAATSLRFETGISPLPCAFVHFAFTIDTDTIHSNYWLVVLPIKAALANVKPLTRGSLVQRRRSDTGQKNEDAYEYGITASKL